MKLVMNLYCRKHVIRHNNRPLGRIPVHLVFWTKILRILLLYYIVEFFLSIFDNMAMLAFSKVFCMSLWTKMLALDS